MKAQELKIGNLIEYAIGDTFNDREPYFGKCIFQVVMIMDDSIKIDIGYDATLRVLFSDPKLKSVMLTEEWLVKFGFEFNNLNETHYFEKFSFRLHLRENEFFYNWIGGNVFIQYVHQLQNLYYALTGEELTIEHTKPSTPIN
jgi:hypothetical protein